jgi:DNA invertase Pin-like site-specific DNA recombinase
MLSIDSTKRAILYARVSTDEQARSGYSLTQQLEALREYALREGYQIVKEISDPGQSGASLERPGIDEVRALVREGTVSLVLAQDRDRFAREPAYHYLLRKEFEEYGCRLKALNDHGGDTPEGELTDGILDQLAKYERAKTTERTRRGRYRRAREGKIVGNANSHYGFSFNEARDAYVINEEEMCVVRRVFRMIGAERMPFSAVKKVLDREGVPLRGGGRFWSRIFLKRIILEDVYKPHTYEEIDSLVSPEVAARLDPARSYGIWWYGQHRWTQTQVAEGGRYRRKRRIALRPPEEWIAVPVPDSGVPRHWVEAARAAVSSNKPPSTGGGHTWELSGGILRCGTCGARMEATFSPRRGPGGATTTTAVRAGATTARRLGLTGEESASGKWSQRFGSSCARCLGIRIGYGRAWNGSSSVKKSASSGPIRTSTRSRCGLGGRENSNARGATSRTWPPRGSSPSRSSEQSWTPWGGTARNSASLGGAW